MVFVAVVTGLFKVGVSWLLARTTCDLHACHRSASDHISDKVIRLDNDTAERNTPSKHNILGHHQPLADEFARGVDQSASQVFHKAHILIATSIGRQFISAEGLSGIDSGPVSLAENSPVDILTHLTRERIWQRLIYGSESLKQRLAVKSVPTNMDDCVNSPFHSICNFDIAALEVLPTNMAS